MGVDDASASGKREEDDEVYKARWRRSDFSSGEIDASLAFVKDRRWVVQECLRRVAGTAEATNAVLSYGLAETDRHKQHPFFMSSRLRLLQFKDRLDTYLGVFMGRFSAKEYKKFRSTSIQKIATQLAEDGKTGALELVMKRHLYSLAPHIFPVLDAVPETLSPHKYEQLLPAKEPPKPLLPRRGVDWVESEHIIQELEDSSSHTQVAISDCTEYAVKALQSLRWPGEEEIVSWYLNRARTIDELSGQLENSMILLASGLQKGFEDLRQLSDDAADLYRATFLVEDTDTETELLSLSTWENLDDYRKFQLMLRNVDENSILTRLVEVGVPFMRKRGGESANFLVRFLRELSSSGSFEICAVVLKEACQQEYSGLFLDELHVIKACLECIYALPRTDQWELMALVLSGMPWKDQEALPLDDSLKEKGLRRGFVSALRYAGNRTYDSTQSKAVQFRRKSYVSEELERRIVAAEGHVQAGQILFHYQIPTPISALVHQDVNSSKQLVRLLLSKFARRIVGRSQSDWDALWRDLQILQKHAFTSLEKEYLFYEFCRGLLKSGEFVLARFYFQGPSKDLLSVDKLENLVIQTAREFFYSANSLDSKDIEMAKECLSLAPLSKSASTESDIIVAVTERLPALGVTLLPAQFRQVKNPMEVVKMAIYSRKETSVPVDDLLEVARLLGLTGTGDMAVVEEAIAREAAAYGDLELAEELCLGLVRKEHGSVWDLCSAIGRGPESEKLEIKARKELLGFALKHCDEESIRELLDAWKDFDVMDQCAEVAESFNMPAMSTSDAELFLSLLGKEADSYIEEKLDEGRRALATAASEGGYDAYYGKDRKKAVAFSCLQLPWLLKVQGDGKSCSTRALSVILYGLGVYGFTPRDDLILKLARSALASNEDYLLSCGYLSALSDARLSLELFNKELERQKGRSDQLRVLKAAVLFSSLQNSSASVKEPDERGQILSNIMRQQPLPVTGSETFWAEQRSKYQEILDHLEQTKLLSGMMPDLDIERLFSDDLQYIDRMTTSKIRSAALDTVADVKQIATMLDELRYIRPHVSPGIYEIFVEESIKALHCEFCETETAIGPHLFSLETRYCVLEKYFSFIPRHRLNQSFEVLLRNSLSVAERHESEFSGSMEVLQHLIKFWIRAAQDMDSSRPGTLRKFLTLLEEGLVTHQQGWELVAGLSGSFDAASGDNFLLALIFAGCSVKAAVKFMEQDTTGGSDLVQVYLHAVQASIEQLKTGGPDSLARVLESAGFGNNDTGDMEAVQHAIRTRLSSLSDDPEIPRETRIRLLEALGRLVKSFGSEEKSGQKANLIALRSTEAALREFGGVQQITVSDLSSLASLTECFRQLAGQTGTKKQAQVLVMLLEEWEALEMEENEETTAEGWGGRDDEDDWDAGWQELEAVDTQAVVWSTHKLHACWKVAFYKLLQFQGLETLLSTLDKWSSNSCRLLTEDEAKDLIGVETQRSPLSALKMALLLPFPALRMECLAIVEGVVKDGSVHLDAATVLLILSTGLVSVLAGEASLSSLFRAVCDFMANLGSWMQTGLLLPEDSLGSPSAYSAFPFFIGELCRGQHYSLAGGLVLQHMKVPFAFATWNASHFALRRYLEAQQVKRRQLNRNYDFNQLRRSSLWYLSESIHLVVMSVERTLDEALRTISEVT